MENQQGGTDYYAVRYVVDERSNQDHILVAASVLSKLYAINAKKVSGANAQTAYRVLTPATSHFSYNIADLLNDVKGVFRDTFSKENADGKPRALPEAWRRNAERMAAEEQAAENAQPAVVSGEEAQTWADMKKFKKVKEGRPSFPPNKDTRIYLPAATDLMTLTSRPL